MKKFILASASPRRRELLEQIGINFDVVVGSTDESGINRELPPELYTGTLSVLKAASAAKLLRAEGRTKEILISADTVVYYNGKILGKPVDEADAKNMLMDLSGKTHEVYTGICVMRISDGFSVSRSVKTEVTFKELSENEIDAYISTGEPLDKAGAYGIQGRGGVFVRSVCGDYSNVVGLPINELYEILADEFNIKIFDKE